MQAAIPKYLQNHLSEAAPGHRFGLYYAGWNDDFRPDDKGSIKAKEIEIDGKKKNAAVENLKRTVCPLPEHSRELLEKLVDRQSALATSQPSLFSWPAIASAPFATGLGNKYPLENGFSFLSPYGLPYLPGSGVKGVIRKAAEELASGDWGDSAGWNEEIIRTLFGPGEEDFDRDRNTPALQGALRFWDVYPAPESSIKNDKPLLAVEIMTPHLGKYYQGEATPNTSLTPNPIIFLAVAAKSHFAFHVECNPARLAPEQQSHWQNLLQAAFEHAGKWLGFGAKTAVGYGRMALDPAIAQQRVEDAEKTRKAATQAAERQRRSQLPPDEQLNAALDDLLGQLPKDPRNDQMIRQITSHNSWTLALDLINQSTNLLDILAKPQREQLASQIKTKLTMAFKVEGKAEKAMKEKLAMICGL